MNRNVGGEKHQQRQKQNKIIEAFSIFSKYHPHVQPQL